jgi:hypothetical protein
MGLFYPRLFATLGMAIWSGIGAEGALATIVSGSGLGTNWKGYYATGLLDAFARGLQTYPDDIGGRRATPLRPLSLL